MKDRVHVFGRVMRFAIIALVALLVLGGAGAGAYFYFQQPAEAASSASGEHEEASKAHGKDGHGTTESGEFVELDPLMLPIIDEYGVNQVVSLVVVIEVADTATAEEVLKVSPRLKDAYIQDMYGVLNRQVAMNGGVLQVGIIKERLNGITHRVLGEGIARDVLLQVVNQRPI